MSQPLPEKIKPIPQSKPPFGSGIIHYPHLGLAVSLLLIIKFSVFYILSLAPVDEIEHYQYHQDLVNFKGYINQVKLLPETSKIIFSAKTKGTEHYQLYLQSTSSSTKKEQLLSTAKNTHYWLIAWSKGSNTLAYIRENHNSCDIYTANINERNHLDNEQKIFSCEQQDTYDLSWSHNGKTLYFLAKKHLGQSATLPDSPALTKLYQFNLNNKSIELFSAKDHENEYIVSASPDGKWLVTIENKNGIRWQVYLYNITSREKKLLLATGLHINDVSWSTTSKHILLATSEGPKYLSLLGEVYSLLADNKNIDTISANYSQSDNTVIVNTIKWQHTLWQYTLWQDINSAQIHSNTNKLKNLASNTTPQRLKAIQKSTENYFPAYANTSRQLVYVTSINSKTEIMLLDEHGNEIQLTNQTPYDFSLTQLKWSKDDTQIMFSANHALYLLNIRTGVITRITDKSYEVDTPSWSSDGRHIYFTANKSGDWQVWRINLAGEDLTQITQHGGAGAKESVDGKTLYFHKYEQEGLWKKSLVDNTLQPLNNTETLLIDDFSRSGYVSWQVFTQGIYYHSFTDRKSAINYWHFAESHSQLIMVKNDKKLNLSHFSVTSDQQLITVLHSTYQSKIQLLSKMK